MANIYNDSSEVIRQAGSSINGNFTNLTVQNLIAQNAAIDNLNVDNTAIVSSLEITNLNNHNILTAGVNGAINGLAIGNNNEVLISNGLNAIWTNSLNINTLSTNTITIPTTVEGDLLVFDNSSQAQRLPIASSGKFLISDGVNPTWNDLPNPLIVGGLQINANAQFSNYANSNLYTDASGFILTERPKFTQGGSQGFTTTPNQFYGSAVWYMTNNAWYKIKVLMTSANTNGFYGTVKVNTNIISYFYYPGVQTQSVCVDQIYLHTGTTGIQGIALTAQTSTGISSISYYQIYLERICEPVLV